MTPKELEHAIEAQSWAERNALPPQHPREAYLPPLQRIEDHEHTNYADWPGRDVNSELPYLPSKFWIGALFATLITLSAIALFWPKA